MTRRSLSARLWFSLFVWLWAAGGAFAADAPRNVILIGWDGCRRERLKEMIGRNEVTNLMALAKEGRLVDIDVTSGATDTKAGWTEILTGYGPDKTGVYSNSRYQPIPAGFTVFERLEAFLGPSNIDTVAIIGKKAHVDNDPPRKVPYDEWQAREKRQRRFDRVMPGKANVEGGQIVEEDGRKYVLVPGKPWYNASQTMDLFENGLLRNERVVRRTLEELEKRKDHRFFFFIHFPEPDHAGHANGEDSKEYAGAIQSDDECTGRIMAKLKELGLYNKTLIYITADHGFNPGQQGHSYAPYVFLATNDPKVSRDGDRADIAPTILERFGVDLAKVDPVLDGIPLDQPAERHPASATPPAGKGRRKAGRAQAQ